MSYHALYHVIWSRISSGDNPLQKMDETNGSFSVKLEILFDFKEKL